MALHTHSNGGDINGLSVTPLYIQVQALLRRLIESGKFKGVLPNEADLAREYKVSAGTMRKALEALEAEGIVIRRQGRGTFVCEAAPWEKELSDAALALLRLLPGRWEPVSDESDPSIYATNGGGSLTASDLRILAAGASEIASWLDRRAASVAQNEAA